MKIRTRTEILDRCKTLNPSFADFLLELTPPVLSMNDNLLSPRWSDSEHNFVAKLVDEGKTPSEVLEAYRAQNQFQPRSEGAIRQHVTLYRATKKGVSEPHSSNATDQFAFTLRAAETVAEAFSKDEQALILDLAEKLCYTPAAVLKRATQLVQGLVQFPPDERKLILQALETLLALKR
jgi:hypothetical protein